MEGRGTRAHPAFGRPGIEPHWTRSAKDGVGTAYSTSSRLWYTLSVGIITEVYFPTIDRPQLRDLQYLVTDGKTFLDDERRVMDSQVQVLSEHALGVRVTSADRDKRYRIIKEIVVDPHQACLMVRTRLEATPVLRGELHLYALAAPHLGVGGRGKPGGVISVARRLLPRGSN